MEALAHRAPAEVVLDVAANGDALVGRVQPAEPDSDADRVLALAWLTRGGRRPWRGGDVLEARWISGTTAVLAHRGGSLLRLAAADLEAGR